MKYLQEQIRKAERRAELHYWLEGQIRKFAMATNLWPLLERAEEEGASFMAWWKHPWLAGTINDDLWSSPTGWALIIELPASAKEWVRTLLPNLDFRKTFSATKHGSSVPLLVESWEWQSGEPDYKDCRDVTIRFKRATFEGERVGDCHVRVERYQNTSLSENWSVSCGIGEE